MKLKIRIVTLLIMSMQQLCAAQIDLGVIQNLSDLKSSVSEGADAFFENLRKQAYELGNASDADGKKIWNFMVDVQSAQELFARLKQQPSGVAGWMQGKITQTYIDKETQKYLLTALSNYKNKFEKLPYNEAYLDKITYFFTTHPKEESSFEDEMNKASDNDSLYQIYRRMNADLKGLYKPFKAPDPATSDIPKKTVNPLLKKTKKPAGELPLEDGLAAQKKVLTGLLALVQAKDVTGLRVALGRAKNALVKKINLAIEGAAIIDVEQLRKQVQDFLSQVNDARPVPKKLADKPVKKEPSAEQAAKQAKDQQAILIKLKQEVDTVKAVDLQAEKHALIQEIDSQLLTIKASGSVALRQLQDKIASFMKKMAEQSAKRPHRPLPSVPSVASKPRKPLPSVPVVGQQQLQMLAESLAELRTKL